MSKGRILAALVLVGYALSAGSQAPPPGQTEHRKGPLGILLGTHGHAPPAPVHATRTPDVFIDATNLGAPVLLDKNWRIGITSNAKAADPDYDDSQWAVRDSASAIADLPDEDHPEGSGGPDAAGTEDAGERPPGHGRPFVWFRSHIKLAQGHGPVSLLIELPVSQSTSMSMSASGPGLDVYANGKMITPQGPHGDAAYRYEEISRIYNLNIPADETNLTIAIRTLYIPFGYYAYTGFFSKRTLRVGNPAELQRAWDLWFVHNLFERLPRLINAFLLGVLSLFLLALYFTQRGHKEYLWLALHEALQAPIGFLDLAGSQARIDQLVFLALLLQLVAISAYLYFEFLIAFLALKKRWYSQALRYSAPLLVFIGPVMMLLGGHGMAILLSLGIVVVGGLLWMIGWFLFIFITLISATIRRNFEAGMLLIPLMLTIIGIGEPILTGGGMSDSMGLPYHSPLTIQAGPVPIHFASIADFAGLLAIVLIIFVRFLRIQHDQERANSELAAARSVQELMIPREQLETPGYEVDSVYNPANEVGGDFFHVQSVKGGGLLVVIGDVAGKGLKAAMNVSMLMGALRRVPETRPSKILESLNRVVAGSESLTTCQALWFGPEGELIMANAGHLPPYLNSQEIFLPGGLPLGALAETTYDEVRLYLHPGDRLLLLSDGVVEARQPSGELFGFDRVHNLSNQSAFYIADAAKEFGQEDDITVLTVRRLAEAAAA